jgi:aspartate/methionine/tyrosine aminotransferase
MNDRAAVTYDLGARKVARALVASQIREVADSGMGDPDILRFWFGEPDEVTPEYIRNAAVASIAAGETFYTQNCGIPELREAIAGYVTGRHRPVAAGHVAVTSSGVSALMLTAQALVDPGDRVVCVTPLWPNLTEIPRTSCAPACNSVPGAGRSTSSAS